MLQKEDVPCHVSIEIENQRCRLLETLKDLGIQKFKVTDIRGSAAGLTRHLVRIPSDQLTKIPKHMAVKIYSGNMLEKETSAWFETEGCDVCSTIISKGSFLVTARNIEGRNFVYTFIAPNSKTAKGVISALEEFGLTPKILGVEKYKTKGSVLTEKQERVLWFALETGFFDYPRKIDTAELSRKLGIMPSTFSEIIRRGIRRLLEHYFRT